MLTLEYKSGKISSYSMDSPGKCADRIKGKTFCRLTKNIAMPQFSSNSGCNDAIGVVEVVVEGVVVVLLVIAVDATS